MADCMEKDWSFTGSDGVHTLYATIWEPSEGEPRAVIQICHGMMEHIRRYDRFARALCDRGFVVCGDDHLGHGRTAEQPEDLGYFGETDGWKHMAEDELLLRREMQRRYPDKPYFLLGHSMGSFITRRVIALDGEGLAGLYLLRHRGTQPLTKLGIGLAGIVTALRGPKRTGRFLNAMAFQNYNRRFPEDDNELAWLSRDKDGYPDASEDPKCHFVFTNAGFRDLFRLLDSVTGPKWSDRVPKDLPIVLFSGEMDPVGSYGKGPRQVYGWLKASGVRDLSLKLYPDARHELHNELNRDEFLEDVVAWCDRHMEGGRQPLPRKGQDL